MSITIYDQVETESDLVDLLRRIAELVEQGFTSGCYPGWELVDNPPSRPPATGTAKP